MRAVALGSEIVAGALVAILRVDARNGTFTPLRGFLSQNQDKNSLYYIDKITDYMT